MDTNDTNKSTRTRIINRVKDRLEMMRRADNRWADLYVRDVAALLRLLGEEDKPRKRPRTNTAKPEQP